MHHAYRRIVLDRLPATDRDATLLGLAVLMNHARAAGGAYVDTAGCRHTAQAIVQRFGKAARDGTLIRRWNGANGGRHRPAESLGSEAALAVAAGQLPDGFDPAALYASRSHPRGLTMALFAMSDALGQLGIPWRDVQARVRPDQIGVYASSSMGQLDEFATGGLLQARLRGRRVSAKQLPLGFNSMPADFINAYVLGNVGKTGAVTGACATFLYNLESALRDIRSGQIRVAVVGNAEAPLLPEVIEGYSTMGALATREALCRLDGTPEPDYRRACRPFGENCGFTLGESAQFIVLFDDQLAIESGAQLYGAVADVFIHADGFKKSISGPGAGNYLTMGRAVASACALLGDKAVRRRSFIEAHGSSTPTNRVTESRIYDQIARAFRIDRWPLTAVKAFVGHSLGPASADQLVNALGVFEYGWLPGIETIGAVAPDVCAERLHIPLEHAARERLEIAFINSKGFGGNNASAVVLAPSVTKRMLAKRHGRAAVRWHAKRLETTVAARDAYATRCLEATPQSVYELGERVIDESAIRISRECIELPGFEQAVPLAATPPLYTDMV